MIKLNIKKHEKAGFLVEAVFVMPIITTIIFILLYLSLYLYDINRMQCALDSALYNANLLIRQPSILNSDQICYEEINSRDILYHIKGNYQHELELCEEHLTNKMKDRLCLGKIKSVELHHSRQSITGSITASLSLSDLPVFSFFVSDTYQVVASVHMRNPTMWVRLLDHGMELVNIKD